MKWNGKNYSTTINDTNGVLSNYDFSGSGLTFSKSGNSLTITAEKAPKDDVLITVNKKNSQRKAVITWTDEKIGPQSGQLQDIVTFGQSVSDPVKAYLNVKDVSIIKKLLNTLFIQPITAMISPITSLAKCIYMV